MPAPGPLHGVRVVALEQAVAAPLCSRQLADLGAEVVKVERPPDGDFARRYDGVVHGESAYFVWLNHGKRSLALDLSAAADRTAFEALLTRADVLVNNLGPGAVDRLGYGSTAIHARWPGLVTCSISGFGPDGPFRDHKAFDLLIQGESGLLSVTGSADEPARVGISIADIAAGTQATIAVLAALRERDRSGRGGSIEISMLEAIGEWMAVPVLVRRYGGADPARSGLHHPTIAPYGPYRAADGRSLLVAVQNEGQWGRFCAAVLDAPGLATDPRFVTNEARVRNRTDLDAAIEDHLRGVESREALLARLAAADVPSGSLNEPGDVIEHPQLAARGAWLEIETPTGPAVVPRSPLGTPALSTVPTVGGDGPAIRAELGDG
jgi:itaconate CoA-transferase